MQAKWQLVEIQNVIIVQRQNENVSVRNTEEKESHSISENLISFKKNHTGYWVVLVKYQRFCKSFRV